jgi:hypothetical protein
MIRLSKTTEERFWNWFSKNSNKYLHFENDQDSLFQELKVELEKIDSNLVFEFSLVFPDGTREFVISADGIKSSFPNVINLVNSAPDLKDWKIIAFRQPHTEITQINYQSLNVHLKDIFFRYTKENGKIGLELIIRGFYESPEWTGFSFVLLDTILGEYNAEMYLSWIDKKSLKDDVDSNNLIPITDLPKILQAYNLEFKN